MLNLLYTIFLDDVGNIISKPSPYLFEQNVTYLAIANQKITHVLVVSELEVQALSDLFEGMAKRAVAEIVNERSRQSFVLDVGLILVTPDNPHQLASGVEHADAMG